MSERFPARKGISASLRQRLGDFGNKQNPSYQEKSRDNIQSMGGAKNKNTSVKKQNTTISRGYNSGDSLEMDEGDDLRGELDGHRAANMVIQVCTHSTLHRAVAFRKIIKEIIEIRYQILLFIV